MASVRNTKPQHLNETISSSAFLKSKSRDLDNSLILEVVGLLADGKITEAVACYIKAINLHNRDISSVRLHHLATSLVGLYLNIIQSRNSSAEIMAGPGALPLHHSLLDSCPLLCPACKGIFVDPVTDYCGHTYCSFCLEDLEFCVKCTYEGHHQLTYGQLHNLRVNVTLAKLVEKLAGMEPSVRVKREAYGLYKGSKFVEASLMVNDAIVHNGKSCGSRVVVEDIFLLLLRSKCFLSLDRPQEALRDVDAVLQVNDQNVQAHQLKDMISSYPRWFDLNGSMGQDMKGIELAIRDIAKCPSSSTTSLPSSSGMSSSSSRMLLSAPKGLQHHQHPRDRFPDAHVTPSLHSSNGTRSEQDLGELHWTNVYPYKCCAPCYNGGSNDDSTGDQRLYGDRNIQQHGTSDIQQHGASDIQQHGTSDIQQHGPGVIQPHGEFKNSNRSLSSVEQQNSCVGKHSLNAEQLISSVEKRRSRVDKYSDDESSQHVGIHDETMAEHHRGHMPKQCRQRNENDSSRQSRSSPSLLSQTSVLLDDSTAECIEKMMKLVTVEDIECTLCYRIFLDPITTPCGHVFCLECMYRSLDHSPKCPLCKEALCSFLASRPVAPTEALVWIMEQRFKEQLDHRKQSQLSELATQESLSKGEDVPIFVCTAAYPSVKCLLHVFEPRYKLMVRRCLKSGTRLFGMCNCSESQQDFINIGTMLEIVEVQYLTDGRSVLQTVGKRRFKVLNRVIRDGYYTAKVSYISDDPIPEDQVAEMTNLVTCVYEKCHKWFCSLGNFKMEQITQHYGPFPAFETPQFVPLPPVANVAAAATATVTPAPTLSDPTLLRMTLKCPLLSSISACRQAAEREGEEMPASLSTPSVLLFPEDGPSWVWYMLAILPLKNDIKTCLLASTSVGCRLLALDKILTTVCSRPCLC